MRFNINNNPVKCISWCVCVCVCVLSACMNANSSAIFSIFVCARIISISLCFLVVFRCSKLRTHLSLSIEAFFRIQSLSILSFKSWFKICFPSSKVWQYKCVCVCGSEWVSETNKQNRMNEWANWKCWKEVVVVRWRWARVSDNAHARAHPLVPPISLHMFASGCYFPALFLCLYEIFFYFIFCYHWMEWCVLCVYQTNYLNRSRSKSIVLYQKCISYACYDVIFFT